MKQNETKTNKQKKPEQTKKDGTLSNDLTCVTEVSKSKDRENRAEELHLELMDNHFPKLIKENPGTISE